jgi:hypothetical protein
VIVPLPVRTVDQWRVRVIPVPAGIPPVSRRLLEAVAKSLAQMTADRQSAEPLVAVGLVASVHLNTPALVVVPAGSHPPVRAVIPSSTAAGSRQTGVAGAAIDTAVAAPTMSVAVDTLSVGAAFVGGARTDPTPRAVDPAVLGTRFSDSGTA